MVRGRLRSFGTLVQLRHGTRISGFERRRGEVSFITSRKLDDVTVHRDSDAAIGRDAVRMRADNRTFDHEQEFENDHSPNFDTMVGIRSGRAPSIERPGRPISAHTASTWA